VVRRSRDRGKFDRAVVGLRLGSNLDDPARVVAPLSRNEAKKKSVADVLLERFVPRNFAGNVQINFFGLSVGLMFLE